MKGWLLGGLIGAGLGILYIIYGLIAVENFISLNGFLMITMSLIFPILAPAIIGAFIGSWVDYFKKKS